MRHNSYVFLALALALAGCQTDPPTSAAGRRAASQSNASGGVNPQATAAQPLAYVDGEPVTLASMRLPLLEAAGGQTLAELVLDRRIQQELTRRGLKVGPTLRDAERDILAQLLSDDPQEGARLIAELRQRRNLGDQRFEQLLQRSAALRLLVQREVEVTDAAVRQAFELQHGERYEARLIVTENLTQAAQLVRRAKAGESFIDLAIAHSTDVSRAQGGLLPLISPHDATFPDVVRKTLAGMAEQQISDPIALEQGFAILKLERKMPADAVRFDDVKERIAQSVRRRIEDTLMRRLRATMLEEADVVILDPALNQSWKSWTELNQP